MALRPPSDTADQHKGGFLRGGIMVVDGFHGTTTDRQSIIDTHGFQIGTAQTYWLGTGIYFFQEAPGHAAAWAQRLADSRGSAPVVYRAEIDLSACLDLMDRTYWTEMTSLWEATKEDYNHLTQLGPRWLIEPSPQPGVEDQIGNNYVDCAFMNTYIAVKRRAAADQGHQLTTVRGIFVGGNPIHPTSWLFRRSTVMISVIDKVAILSTRRV